MLIKRFAGSAPWEAIYGYSRVVVAGDWAITAGTTATGPDGVLDPGDAYRQAVTAFTIALEALQTAGITIEQVVRTRMYVTDMNSQQDVGRAHQAGLEAPINQRLAILSRRAAATGAKPGDMSAEELAALLPR